MCVYLTQPIHTKMSMVSIARIGNAISLFVTEKSACGSISMVQAYCLVAIATHWSWRWLHSSHMVLEKKKTLKSCSTRTI